MTGPPKRRNPRPGEGARVSEEDGTGNNQKPKYKTPRDVRKARAPGHTAMSVGIERMVAEGRLDGQRALLGEHLASVRRLWVDTPNPLR